MDFLAGPAVLGGIAMCVALGALPLVQQRAGPRPDECGDALPPGARARARAAQAGFRRRGSGPDSPCQHAARAERAMALEAASSLSELHDEISAYRQTQRGFLVAGLERRGADAALASGRGDCRYLGLSGQPTCPAAPAVLATCACGGEASPRPDAQPSPALLRV
jgi:hypothetical protein